MAEWTPTPEMVEAGVQAVWEATMRTTVMYQTHRSERAREVRAALTAAYPLIAAQVLRDAADRLVSEDRLEMASGYSLTGRDAIGELRACAAQMGRVV